MLSQPLSRTTLQGVWAALITPWTDKDELDEPRFVDEIRAYEDTGVAGIYTGGTTGEFYAQDDATFAAVTRIACREGHAAGLPVQIGCTALSTRTVQKRIAVAVAAGADGIQAALPFWLPLTDLEAGDFFRDLAVVAGETPLVLYHSDRAKRMLSPKLIERVAAEVPTFIGMKYPTVDAATLSEILARVGDFAVFVGEPKLWELTPLGAQGCYSSVSGLNPRLMARLYKLLASSRRDEARLLSDAVTGLVEEVLRPMVEHEGLWDSAVDRVLRVAGGVDVGLRCQRPYRSATSAHVARLLAWCEKNAPVLLPS